MEVETILATLARDPGCVLGAPRGLPQPAPDDQLPGDVERFYRACGGLRFIESVITIVAPTRFVSANEAIVGDPITDDESASWYIVAESGTEATAERIVNDLGQRARGRCYDAFWDRYGVAGSMPIVATSFTDLLEQLMVSGGWPFRSEPSFVSRGDAYDTP